MYFAEASSRRLGCHPWRQKDLHLIQSLQPEHQLHRLCLLLSLLVRWLVARFHLESRLHLHQPRLHRHYQRFRSNSDLQSSGILVQSHHLQRQQPKLKHGDLNYLTIALAHCLNQKGLSSLTAAEAGYSFSLNFAFSLLFLRSLAWISLDFSIATSGFGSTYSLSLSVASGPSWDALTSTVTGGSFPSVCEVFICSTIDAQRVH